jgi:hypothetical protein
VRTAGPRRSTEEATFTRPDLGSWDILDGDQGEAVGQMHEQGEGSGRGPRFFVTALVDRSNRVR